MSCANCINLLVRSFPFESLDLYSNIIFSGSPPLEINRFQRNFTKFVTRKDATITRNVIINRNLKNGVEFALTLFE